MPIIKELQEMHLMPEEEQDLANPKLWNYNEPILMLTQIH